jgi:hypothetical protein
MYHSDYSHHGETMARDTTTIQVRRPTAERLNALKAAGLTYDDVINLALDYVPPAEIQRLFEAWQAQALASLKADPRVRKGRPIRKR